MCTGTPARSGDAVAAMVARTIPSCRPPGERRGVRVLTTRKASDRTGRGKFSIFPYPSSRLLRDGVHGGQRITLRHDRFGAALRAFPAPGRPADGRRHRHPQEAPSAQGVRADVRAQMGHGFWGLRHQRRLLPELRRAAGIDRIIPVDVYIPAARRGPRW